MRLIYGERRRCRRSCQVPSLERAEYLEPTSSWNSRYSVVRRACLCPTASSVRAARPGLRRWTVWCRFPPATRCPFWLLDSGRCRLPRAPLPQAALASQAPEQQGEGACPCILATGSWFPWFSGRAYVSIPYFGTVSN
jgi:hypothetical protein